MQKSLLERITVTCVCAYGNVTSVNSMYARFKVLMHTCVTCMYIYTYVILISRCRRKCIHTHTCIHTYNVTHDDAGTVVTAEVYTHIHTHMHVLYSLRYQTLLQTHIHTHTSYSLGCCIKHYCRHIHIHIHHIHQGAGSIITADVGFSPLDRPLVREMTFSALLVCTYACNMYICVCVCTSYIYIMVYFLLWYVT